MYGDDIGLSAARARRAMDTFKQDPALAGARAEHEGRGYVQSDDVVNAGFIQGEESFVRVQVVYDEPAPLDDSRAWTSRDSRASCVRRARTSST